MVYVAIATKGRGKGKIVAPKGVVLNGPSKNAVKKALEAAYSPLFIKTLAPEIKKATIKVGR